MAYYIYGPQWFHGIDSSIELLSVVVAFVICFYSYKIYRLTKQRNYAFFASSFLLVALAYIFKIISEIVVYSKYVEQRIIGPFVISRVVVEPVTWVHMYAHATFRLLLTFAFFILLMVALRVEKKQTLILLTYFMVVITIISSSLPFLFHLTHVLMLGLLVQHFYHNHRKLKADRSLCVLIAFSFILVTHILMIFKTLNPALYATGLVSQLIGFGALIYAFILVKKK